MFWGARSALSLSSLSRTNKCIVVQEKMHAVFSVFEAPFFRSPGRCLGLVSANPIAMHAGRGCVIGDDDFGLANQVAT